ncbi:MAG: SseB family protein [Neomegalonema sp.]|nr:SseB family protein [Neomegalonema sp.]
MDDPIPTDFQPLSRLDAAWAEMRRSGEDEAADAASARYLDILLSEVLLCPLASDPDEEGNDPDAIEPLIVEHGGVGAVVVFDSEDRLANFLTEPTAHVALPGRAYFEMLDGAELPLILNPGIAPVEAVFEPQTISTLAATAEMTDEELASDGFGNGQILPPKAPEALLTTLATRLAAARSLLVEAWLVFVDRDDEQVSTLALALEASEGASEAGLRSLALELSQLGAAHLDEIPLEVLILPRDAALFKTIREQGFALFGGHI